MKKSRLRELAGIKKPLNEGNVWDRNADGTLPTLADTTARYANESGGSDLKEEYNLKIKTIAEELLELVKQDEERGGALSGGSVDYPLFYDLASAIMEKHKVR